MEGCKDILCKGHEVYFDNYFSSVDLAVGSENCVSVLEEWLTPLLWITKITVLFSWMQNQCFLLTFSMGVVYSVECIEV